MTADSPIARRTFLGSALGAALVGAAPRRSAPWRFPGTLCIYARRVPDAEPFVSHNANRGMPAASVIKLVILTGIAREIDAGTLHWNDTLHLTAREIVGGSESFGSAQRGAAATVRELALAMIAQSDNTAGNVLADHLGFGRVNAVAESLGLSQTRLRRHFMDFAARARGIDNTTSARDMGELLVGLDRGARGMRQTIASARACRTMVGFMLRQEDKDTIPDGISRHVAIANKTGVLTGVRNDVAIVDPFGSDAYVVALLSAFPPGFTRTAYADLRLDARRVDRYGKDPGGI